MGGVGVFAVGGGSEFMLGGVWWSLRCRECFFVLCEVGLGGGGNDLGRVFWRCLLGWGCFWG
jgi:hypothetical protein